MSSTSAKLVDYLLVAVPLVVDQFFVLDSADSSSVYRTSNQIESMRTIPTCLNGTFDLFKMLPSIAKVPL